MSGVSKTVFGIATSIAAAALTLAIFTIGDSLTPVLKWTIVAATGIAGFVVALLSAKKVAGRSIKQIVVGERIRAGKDVEVSDVSISASNADTARVGTNLRAKGSARVKHIRLGRPR